MKVKTVKRYYCDHCKLSKGTKESMVRHERGCTKNPNRVCGMCEIRCEAQLTLTELSEAISRDILANKVVGEYGEYIAIAHLRAAAVNCPACILFALRNDPRGIYTDFDFKEESRAFWAEVNSMRERC